VNVPILLYHDVSPVVNDGLGEYAVTPEIFSQHIRWLRRSGRETVRLDELVAQREGGTRLPERPVIITFDDGFRSCFEYAVPVLEQAGYTAVFFLVAGLVGAESAWHVQAHRRPSPLMGWDAIRRLRERGFSFGSHTLSHRRLPTTPSAICSDELTRSRLLLEQRLEQPVLDLAYPYGGVDARVRELVREAGYRSACTSRPAVALEVDDLLLLPRLPVRRSTSLRDFRQLLEPAGRPS
jgi:peptidoglycan/xylan/chitin deacetylase (PgdA/CDA1 family)